MRIGLVDVCVEDEATAVVTDGAGAERPDLDHPYARRLDESLAVLAPLHYWPTHPYACMPDCLPGADIYHAVLSGLYPEPPVHQFGYTYVQSDVNWQSYGTIDSGRCCAHASSDLTDVWLPLLSNVSSAAVSVTATLSKLPLYTSSAAVRFLIPEISVSITVLRSAKLSPTHPGT